MIKCMDNGICNVYLRSCIPLPESQVTGVSISTAT